MIGQDAHLGVVEASRIGLDGKLVIGKQGQPAQDAVEQGLQLRGAQMRGGAAAEKEGADRLGFFQPAHLKGQGVDVFPDALVLSDRDGEVAITAMMAQNGTCI